MEKKILELKGLTKHYEGFSLENIDLEIPYGCIMGLIGENGAGKSTTIKSILGLVQPDAGEVEIFGKKRSEHDEAIKEDIGVVLGELTLPVTFNGKEICRMMHGIYKKWNDELFYHYLEQFHINKNKKIKDYSRGMKMKAALAIALSHDAKFLILDEPTSGLDPVIREDVLDILREFVMDEEHAVLISSHIIDDLEKTADYIAFIHEGHLILCDEKDRLRETYRILKCSREMLKTLSEAGKIEVEGVRENHFAVDALVKNIKLRPSDGEFVLEPAGLNDIMIYMVRGEKL